MLRRLIAVVGLLVLAGLFHAVPAWAEPTVKVSKVFQRPCDGPVCDSDDDTAVSENAVVRNGVQIHVTASSALSLEEVELDARRVVDGDPGAWVCLRVWQNAGSSFSDYYNWDTDSWPGSAGDPPGACDESSAHGDLTRNGIYDLRVKATDATGSASSSNFTIKISNGAASPDWADDPSVSGASSREPVVELRWHENAEPDVIEYHFIRNGPTGEDEFAVSASRPGGQGCDKEGDVYVCYDDLPTEGYGGDYTYTLIALRSSPSSRQSCSLPPYGDCVESQAAGERSLSIEEPPPPRDAAPPPPTDNSNDTSTGGSGGSGGTTKRPTRVPGSGGSGGSSREFFTGSFDRTLPYDDPRTEREFELPGGEGRTPVAIGPDGDPVYDLDTSGRARAMRVLAGGLLLLLGAAHLARLLRENAPVA